MNFVVQAILALLCCYLAGSVLFGLIIAETVYGVDIRQFGSGNVGFTNIKRTLGWKPALSVLFLDALKGVAAVWLARRVFTGHGGAWEQYLVLTGGVLSIIGHNWSAFFNFAGGKGVATSLGVLFALDYRVGLLAMIVGFPLLLYPGYMSLASTVGAASVPLWFWYLKDPLPYRIFGAIVFVFVLVRHRSNWKRIQEGTEARFNFRGRSEGLPVVPPEATPAGPPSSPLLNISEKPPRQPEKTAEKTAAATPAAATPAAPSARSANGSAPIDLTVRAEEPGPQPGSQPAPSTTPQQKPQQP